MNTSSAWTPPPTYYVQVPLNSAGLLLSANGERLRDRLVHVSHLNRPFSLAHSNVNNDYLPRTKQIYSPAPPTSAAPSDWSFYTALITFKSTPENHALCRANAGQVENETAWWLCAPLGQVRELRIWASKSEALGEIHWVALNYLSGSSEAQRLAYSHLLIRKPGERIVPRAELEPNQRPLLDELLPKPKSVTESVESSFTTPLSCIVGTLNPFVSSSTNNRMCGRSNAELKYSIKLRPLAKSGA